jgi:hypothetical protein
MTHLKTLLVAAPLALGMLAAPAAHAEWRGDWHGGYHRGPGFPLAGALLGLGAAAVVGGIIASQPHVVYAPPPPVYYPAPAYSYSYAYPPAYYAPPPYYAAPGY